GQGPSRFSGLTDRNRFAAALREVASVWSPLLGLHIPQGTGRKRKAEGMGGGGGGGMGGGAGLGGAGGGGDGGDYSEYGEQLHAFKCLRVSPKRRAAPLPEAPKPSTSVASLESQETLKSGNSNLPDFRAAAAAYQEEYALFQPSYLLLLEGERADSRSKIFCRLRRKSLLEMGFGAWKIGAPLRPI
ncbi:hypothetical protein B484DRAFT_407335, partial [Ochromonadaceae sp. CCMP2298]